MAVAVTLAWPAAFVVAVADDSPALAPVDGAANVTVTPLTGVLLASRTVTWSEVAKAVLMAVDCGVLPAVAVMLAAAPAVLVRAKVAGVAAPAALAVML